MTRFILLVLIITIFLCPIFASGDDSAELSQLLPRSVPCLSAELSRLLVCGNTFDQDKVGEELMKPFSVNSPRPNIFAPSWFLGEWKNVKSIAVYKSENDTSATKIKRSILSDLQKSGLTYDIGITRDKKICLSSNYWTMIKSTKGEKYIWVFFRNKNEEDYERDNADNLLALKIRESAILISVDRLTEKILDVSQLESVAEFKKISDDKVQVNCCARIYGQEGKSFVTCEDSWLREKSVASSSAK